jgi:hypothetical protein
MVNMSVIVLLHIHLKLSTFVLFHGYYILYFPCSLVLELFFITTHLSELLPFEDEDCLSNI